jgi:poly-gamma-glutamate synthesis protein (capsule biosynthesis protein)
MRSSLLTYLFTGVLFIQLLTLSASFTVPVTSIGEVEHIHNTSLSSQVGTSTLAYESASLELGTYSEIILVGDIMLGRHVERLMKREGGDYPFRGVPLNALSENAAIIGNFEASVPAVHVPTPNYQLQFSVATTSLNYLQEAGFTHFSLANNHSFDHGEYGYRSTLQAFQEANISVFGSGRDVTSQSISYIETTIGKVAIVAINTSDSGVNYEQVADVMATAEEASVFQIIYIHWGLEYQPKHSRSQKQFATFLVSKGADLIVGHHPHVVQDVDSIAGVPVFYSLGNYIFDQYFSTAVQEGLVLSIDIKEESPVITLHPVSSIGTLSQPYLMNETKQRQFLSTLARKSHPDLQSSIQSGVITLPIKFATSTKMAMINE